MKLDLYRQSASKVWIIDDEEMHFVLVSSLLDSISSAHDSLHFERPQTALEKLKKMESGFPNLILLDLGFDGFDGFDFLNEFKEMSCSNFIKVIVLTSSPFKVDQKRTESYDCVKGYILKSLMLTSLKDLFSQNQLFLNVYPNDS